MTDNPRRRRGLATLAAIAEEAGVSVPTVSKVLHGRADVADATRSRVETLLDRYAYPRPAAGRRTPKLVDVVFPALNNSWAMAILAGVEEAARPAGLGAVVSVHGADDGEHDWIGDIVRRGTAGVLLASVDLTVDQRRRLDAADIAYVAIDPTHVPPDSVPSVGATNWAGGLAATEHLIELGHERIAVIGGPRHQLGSRARVDGYRAALARAYLQVPEDYVRYGTFGTRSGRAEMAALLDLPRPPSAVFACSDLMALGAHQMLRERGVAVPDQVSLIGFDDRPEARWMTPGLTSVRQPLAEMGRTAFGLLIRLRRGSGPSGRPESTRVELSTTLVVRGTTRGAKA